MQEVDREALRLALRWLVDRELSSTEITSKLRAKGHSEMAIDSVLDWLRTKKLANDERVARSRIEGFLDGRRTGGRLRIRAELERAGLADDLIEDVMAEISDEDEHRRMAELLARKFPQGATRAKAGRFLVSRGFEEEMVDAVLDAWLSD